MDAAKLLSCPNKVALSEEPNGTLKSGHCTVCSTIREDKAGAERGPYRRMQMRQGPENFDRASDKRRRSDTVWFFLFTGYILGNFVK